jgi:hypothetical protein
MAKGQQRAPKEKKKPKAAHNVQKKGGPTPPSRSGLQPTPNMPMPGGKK